MSGKGRDLSSEEKGLWRRVAAALKPRRPIKHERPAEPASNLRPQPKAPSAAKKPADAVRPASRPPVARDGEKRVRRGKIEVGGCLDLHGHSQASARAALARFLVAAQARGDRAVIVVTGIGRAGEGVLKRRLPDWLAEDHVRPLISGFAQAHRAHGGAGAFYVFLKLKR